MTSFKVQLTIDGSGIPREISMWHLFFGEWVHISQIINDDGIKEYYTNGVKEEFNDTNDEYRDGRTGTQDQCYASSITCEVG